MRRLVLLLCTALTCCTAAGSAPRVAEPALLREGGLSGLPRGTGTTLHRGVHEVGFPPPLPVVLLIFLLHWCPDATLAELLEARREHVPAAKAQVKFHLRSSPRAEEDGCALAVGHRQRLEDCKFNATAKTFFIIHGWTVRMEDAAPRSRRPLGESELPRKGSAL